MKYGMSYLKEVEAEYLKLTNGQYSVPVPLCKFTFNQWSKFIECDIKFKVEFLTFPSWAGKFEYIKLNGELYSHIKIKSPL
jgi:hypothetical protein